MCGGNNPCGGYPQMYPAGAPYQGSTFILIVVLFILLIIVGSSFITIGGE
ncbi:YjcZ family sporulation protein [Paenisporosarcina sp. NPDC076898]